MKRFVIAIGFVLLLVPVAFAREQSVLARVTVYWAHHQGATGARLHAGHCAVDPSKIPYGSKVLFPDASCLAVDTGPAVINRKAARLSGRTTRERSALVIDRYFKTKTQALAWAKVHPHFMTVQVISPDSHAKPKEQLHVVTKSVAQENSSLESTGNWWTPISNLALFTRSSSNFSSAVSPIDIRGPLVPTFLAF
jgi:hypothetical protein